MKKLRQPYRKQLGMDSYIMMYCLEKRKKVKEYQAKGEVVAMTGDGE